MKKTNEVLAVYFILVCTIPLALSWYYFHSLKAEPINLFLDPDFNFAIKPHWYAHFTGQYVSNILVLSALIFVLKRNYGTLAAWAPGPLMAYYISKLGLFWWNYEQTGVKVAVIILVIYILALSLVALLVLKKSSDDLEY